MSNIIDKIQVSGVTYDIGGTGGGGNPTVELTQAEYEALVTAGTVSADTYYIITDAQAGDLTNYYTKTETNTLLGGKADTATTYTKTEVDTALGGKQATLVSGTNIKTINNESILGSGNIDIQGGGGGGKAIEAGRGISIATGATADTVSFDLPIYSGGTQSIKIGKDNGTLGGYYNLSVGNNNTITGEESIVVGSGNNGNNTQFSAIFGFSNKIQSYQNYCVVGGENNQLKNSYETSFGNSSSTNRNNYGFGDSGNTLFTIGNGYDWSKPHNALEVRQNGDIYIADTNDTSTSNYYQKPMIKLQDALGGGGGSSYTAGDGIDITNDVISVTGKVDTTTYNTYTAATDTALASKQTTLTAGTGISIVDNVISAEGGGKAIEAGRGISIATGETADTVSFNLPISAGTGTRSIICGGNCIASKTNSAAFGNNASAKGQQSFAINQSTASGQDSFSQGISYAENYLSAAFGRANYSKNQYELSCGSYNNSVSATTTFGDSGNTLFSVGNGTESNARHNAFEIRQNGDIYLNNGTNDVKLQEYLQIKAVQISQSDYDQLQTKDPNTLYCIVN